MPTRQELLAEFKKKLDNWLNGWICRKAKLGNSSDVTHRLNVALKKLALTKGNKKASVSLQQAISVSDVTRHCFGELLSSSFATNTFTNCLTRVQETLDSVRKDYILLVDSPNTKQSLNFYLTFEKKIQELNNISHVCRQLISDFQLKMGEDITKDVGLVSQLDVSFCELFSNSLLPEIYGYLRLLKKLDTGN